METVALLARRLIFYDEVNNQDLKKIIMIMLLQTLLNRHSEGFLGVRIRSFE